MNIYYWSFPKNSFAPDDVPQAWDETTVPLYKKSINNMSMITFQEPKKAEEKKKRKPRVISP